jgi:isoleucyl-tRNA synthetase
MKYHSNTRRRSKEYEAAIAKWWKDNKTFEQSVEKNKDDYVFYDGPPFITGAPHHGTLLSSIVKDAIPRYQTMRGKRVERRWGWDCHGLPAENFVEKQLGITDRRDIGTRVSLEEYITKARESMVANSETWESTIDRIGRWVDFKGAYKTMDKDFMESVWWAFKTLYDRGKIYEGEKVLMYDTHFATVVSKSEVTMDNDAYQTVTDPSVYVKFKMIPGQVPKTHDDWITRENTYLLAWTTTPWTLPANTALAVNPDLNYWEVKVGDDVLVIAKDLVDKVLVDEKNQPIEYEVIFDDVFGRDLIGLEYEPIFSGDSARGCPQNVFPELSNQQDNRAHNIIQEKILGADALAGPEKNANNAYKIYAADYVTTDSGTGIVHLAPIYGEVDFELAQKMSIPKVHVLDDEGFYFPEETAKLRKIFARAFGENYDEILKKAEVKTDAQGNFEVWTSNKMIAKALEKIGVVWKIEMIRHEYPFNPRSKQRIMYRAIPSWFFDIQGSKPLMLSQNEGINWFPEHLKEGRFKKNIEQAPDWTLSRNRFWATAMPVWKGDKGSIKVIGSYAELEDLSGQKLEDYHRPWVDGIEFDLPYEAAGPAAEMEHFIRIPEVLDCWFESGSMPFAQLHYPFENKAKFEQNYPADFIVEYIGQVRAWFYYVHAIGTALFGEKAFKNVITTGVVAGNDGRKMSKSLGNFTDPNLLMDEYSADSLRFLLLSSPLLSGEDFALLDKDVSDVARKLTMIWNMYDFFTMYAEVDNWEYKSDKLEAPKNLENPLDQWIIARLYQLQANIAKHMDGYNLPDALSDVLPFIDDASNWFVRRSRRRFWKSESDTDKSEAYVTLHFVLSHLAILLAPFAPFLAEELWHKMVSKDQSVHLQNWPEQGAIDQKVIKEMSTAREIIASGLALRMDRGDGIGQIKIRQPLQSLEYGGEKLDVFYEQIIADEVNVKQIRHNQHANEVKLDKNLTAELKSEGQAREIIRIIQNARKNAGLNIDDRIILQLNSNNQDLKNIFTDYSAIICAETLAEYAKVTGGYEETSGEIEVKLAKK